jgi:CheY-like chemotaxis protein
MSTVMIADDSPSSRDTFTRLLQDGGHKTLCVSGGEAAVDALDTAAADVIVVHLGAAELDGLALLENLHEHPRWRMLPVVILLAASDTHCICLCDQLAAQGCRVRGTFSVAQVLAQVERYTGPSPFPLATRPREGGDASPVTGAPLEPHGPVAGMPYSRHERRLIRHLIRTNRHPRSRQEMVNFVDRSLDHTTATDARRALGRLAQKVGKMEEGVFVQSMLPYVPAGA